MIKKILILSMLLLFTVGTKQSTAKIVRVLLYPKGATLTCEKAIVPGPITFYLPGGADPSTLTISTASKEVTISSISWERATKYQSSKIIFLQKKIVGLVQKKQLTELDLKTNKTLTGFWQEQSRHPWPAAKEALEINNQLKIRLAPLLKEGSRLKDKINSLKQEINNLREQLAQICDPDRTGKILKPWKVNCLLNGPANRKCILTWSYFHPHCGFKFRYLLNAFPEKKQISFVQQVNIWQKTGQDWSQVQLDLASARPSTRLTPPPVWPWIIRPVPCPIYGQKKNKARIALLDAAAPHALSPRTPETKTTFQLWSLAPTSLATGRKIILTLNKEVLPATFSYLLRPEQSRQGFLKSKVDFLHPRDLPKGKAMLFLHRAFLGTTSFALKERTKEIFLGTDPLLQVRQELDKKQSGQRFLSQKQTMTWQWSITITNQHSYPVKATLQEANPQSRDKRIKVDLQGCQPAPDHKGPKLLSWTLKLAALSTQKLHFLVMVTAPKDLCLEYGR